VIEVTSFVESYRRQDGDHGYPATYWSVHLSCGHSINHRGDGVAHLPLMLRCDKCERVAGDALGRSHVAPV
jgi:hypothetical protein